MNKQTNYVIFVFVCLSVSINVFSQTETFDIATYEAPKDFKKEPKPGVVNYIKVDNSANTFCVFSIYASSKSTGDAQEDFRKSWKELAVTPHKAMVNPQTETQTTADGWTVITGASPIQSDGINVYLLLSVASGFGKTMSIRTSFNDVSYTSQIDEILTTMEFDKNETSNEIITPARATQASNGTFGLLQYHAPVGWSEEIFADGVVFKPTDIPAGEHIAIQVMPALNQSGTIEQALEASFVEATTMYNGSSMFQSGGKYSKNISAISYNGWEYLRGRGGIRINDGSQFGTEYGLELFVIKVNNRFERVAILDSRKYCNGSSLYYASDRRSYRNAIESFLFSFQFSDFNGKILSPGSITGNGIVGLWQGTMQSTTASSVKLEVFSPIFLSNGQVYLGSKFPTEGLAGVNTQLPSQLNNRDWGTYSYSNGSGVIQMPYATLPFKKEGNQLIIIKNQRNWSFFQLPSVDGAMFNGTYQMATVNGRIPGISFSADGNFTDDGALKELYHEHISCLNPAIVAGSGTYLVKDYSILFNYYDGRKITIAFLGAGFNKADQSPKTLRLSFNEDPLTRR